MEKETNTTYVPVGTLNLKYKADGTIDYTETILDGMNEHNKNAVLKYKDEECTGILSPDKHMEYHNNLKKKPELTVYTPKKPKIPKIKETPEKEENPAYTPIPKTISKVQQEIIDYPELKSQLIGEVMDKTTNYEHLTTPQKINVYDVGNKWGKTDIKLYGTTQIGSNIHRHKVINFGSIDDYDIDTIPIDAIRGKGQEITYLSQIRKSDKNKSIISRRFISNVLASWCHTVGILYTTHGNSGDINGIDLWGRDTDVYDRKVINGYDAVRMLKDLLLIIRNKTISSASPQLLYIFKYIKKYSDTTTDKEIIDDMKKRIYWDFNVGRFGWAYPKIHPEYIIELLDLLKPSNYLMDICVPLVYDRYRYPIRCTDISIHPMTDEQHSDNADDYDLNRYIAERE